MLNIFDMNDNTKIVRLNNLTTINTSSYFSESLNYIFKAKKEYNENSKVLYKRILESNGNEQIINESFSEYFNNILRFIDKFLKFIRTLVDKFILYLNNLIRSNRYLKNNIHKLDIFNSSHTFKIEGHTYTFSDNVPLVIPAKEFIKDFNDIKIPEDIKSIYTVFIEKILDDYYDKFRGRVLGFKNDYISLENFSRELLMVFRGGSIEKDTITITPDTLNKRINFFNNYKNIEKNIRDLKNKTESQYNDILKFIKSSANIKYGPNLVFLDIMKHNPNWKESKIHKEYYRYINLFIKAKASQIENISNIYALAFGAKLDALKSCFVQDSQVLYRALQKI